MFNWREEFWKLFSAYGLLWSRHEQAKAQLEAAERHARQLERHNARLTSDNSRLVDANQALNTENLRLRQQADQVAQTTVGEVVAQVEAAYQSVRGA